MKTLMTGAAGPKVGHVVARHLAKQHNVVGVDVQSAPHVVHKADIAAVQDWSAMLDGVDTVVHFAALHAPHRDTHSREAFLETNVHATARLLDAAKRAGATRFIFASSTSVYGRAMRNPQRAAWVTEALTPVAEDIYDETKLAAEQLCRDAFTPQFQTTAIRFSRCFPEPSPLMAQYRLHRGVDARDVAHAFQRALETARDEFTAFNISGPSPFLESDCEALLVDAVTVLEERVPGFVDAFRARGWALPARIDRVYVVDKAITELGYAPQHDWRAVIAATDLAAN